MWCTELRQVSRTRPPPGCPRLCPGNCGKGAHVVSVGTNKPRARGAGQPPFITHVCSAPSKEPATRRGTPLCVDTAALGFLWTPGSQMLRGPFSAVPAVQWRLPCRGCCGWGDLAMQVPCRYTLSNIGISGSQGFKGLREWGPVQDSRDLGRVKRPLPLSQQLGTPVCPPAPEWARSSGRGGVISLSQGESKGGQHSE